MTASNTGPMTASKIWAVTAATVVVGGGLVGAALYYKQHPDMPQVQRLLENVPGKAPAPTPAPETKSEKAPASVPAPPLAEKPAPQQAEIAKEEPAPLKPEPATGHGEPPHFDVVRVEPSGETVVAGKGDPDSRVALMASGKVVAEAKTDANGQFVILPPPLKPGDHDLSLRESPNGKPTVESKQNVAVSVPKKAGDQVVVALAEPGKPTKLLTAPPEAKAPEVPPPVKEAPPSAAAPKPNDKVALAKPDTKVSPPAEAIGLAIRSAELENGTGFFASGVARAGTPIEVYLNGSHLAQVVAGPDGQWTVTVKRGLAGGHYTVRADALDGRKVVARVEVPFDVPVAMAEAPKPAAQPAPQVAPTPPAPQPKAEAPKAAEPQATAPQIAAAEQPAPQTKAPSPVPIPRPDVAARAKAAVAAAPEIAPPTLAVAPPVPPAERKTTAKAAETPIAPATRAADAPTLAGVKPTVAPPKPADIAAVPPPATEPAVVAAKPAEPAVAAKPAEPAASAKPATQAETAPSTQAAASPPTANAVIDQIETTLVVRGDNLWDISRIRLGNGMRYTQIYAANVSQIRNPNLIYPGQVFVMPQP